MKPFVQCDVWPFDSRDCRSAGQAEQVLGVENNRYCSPTVLRLCTQQCFEGLFPTRHVGTVKRKATLARKPPRGRARIFVPPLSSPAEYLRVCWAFLANQGSAWAHNRIRCHCCAARCVKGSTSVSRAAANSSYLFSKFRARMRTSLMAVSIRRRLPLTLCPSVSLIESSNSLKKFVVRASLSAVVSLLKARVHYLYILTYSVSSGALSKGLF